MRRWDAYHRICLLIALIVAGLFAQSQLPTTTAVGKVPDASSKHTHRPVQLRLKQQRGLRLLKAAESEASGLRPEMGAFVFWRVSAGYAVIDRSRADRALQKAFLATQSMEPGPDDEGACQESPDCRTKSWLQTSLLKEIMQRSPELAEQLLPKTDPLPRKQATAALAELFVKRKEFSHTEALLTGLADEDNYPFAVATDLLLAMPKDSPELLTVLSQALRNFQQHDQNPAPQLNDFPTMLVRFWRHLPPATALAMVDAVLEESRDADDKGAFRVSFSTLKGAVAFNSTYRLRLFQMLPILEVLDKDRAESLLQADTETQAALARYPQGMQSLDPGDYQDNPAEKRESSIYGVRYSNGPTPTDSTESLNEQVDNEIDRRVKLISLECSKDPKQALIDAMNLPQSNRVQSGFSSPRLVALMSVASGTVEQEPTIARAALDESRKNLEGIQPFQQGRSLTEATQLYLKLGEIESAKKTLQELLKTAERAYAADTNADDPNQAFKGQWPSAFLWLASVRLAARISPELAEQTTSLVTDQEIAAAVRVAYANSLLGSPSGPSEVVEQHKNGQSMYSFPEP